jgi:hypothetical protein
MSDDLARFARLRTLPGTLFTRIRSALDSAATLDPHVLPRGPVA